MNISVVVPIYNSESSLQELTMRLELVLKSVSDDSFEVILVDDCSRDRSWAVVNELAQSKNWVQGIQLMRNYGQHNALLAGIRAAKHDVIVTLDDDLQNPPEEIPQLVNKLNEGYDVVYGTPEKGQHGLWRNLLSRVTKLALQGSMGIQNARDVSPFRVFRTHLRDAFSTYRSPYVAIDVLLTWGTTRFAAVTVKHDSRRSGVSNYTFRKLVVYALNLMTGFSTWPLKFASMVGFAFTLFGIGVLLYVLALYMIQGSPVQGFPFLASIIAIFAGAQLFALGIIGEYLARMHFRMMERPTYAIRLQTRGGDRDKG